MVIVALPFAAYGMIEFHAQLRARRDRAIAQRPKYASPPRLSE